MRLKEKFLERKFIVELPPRRDNETVVEERWDIKFDEPLDFEGQRFLFPEGLVVAAAVQWLEMSLLSVRLSLNGALVGECARCLDEAQLAISDDLMYLYYSRGVELGKDTKLASDDGFMPVEIDFFERTLDIRDQIEESLLMLLPLKLLCREDCAGLCSFCGANRNEGSCGCKAVDGDPRFAVLGDFSAD